MELPFTDNVFDIAFSNSVIEHVGTLEKQQALRESATGGAQALDPDTRAQLSNRDTLLAPYVQYLPKRVEHRIVRWTPRGLLTHDDVHDLVDEVRLLAYREVKFREAFRTIGGRSARQTTCGLDAKV